MYHHQSLTYRTQHLKFNVILVADGSARPNPGPIGWAVAIAKTSSINQIKEYTLIEDYGHHGTNNFAETQAIVEGLRYCPDHSTPLIITDSLMAVRALTGPRTTLSPDFLMLRSLAQDFIWWKNLNFYKENIIRITGHQGQLGLHTIVDARASHQSTYAKNLLS